jgi:hypothetical protein
LTTRRGGTVGIECSQDIDRVTQIQRDEPTSRDLFSEAEGTILPFTVSAGAKPNDRSYQRQ